MLNSIHIQNFRLFKDFHINDLAPVNLIVGKNNTGKSTLLEAIHLLVNQKSGISIFDLIQSRRETTQENGSPRYEFEHLFYKRQVDNNVVIRLAAQNSPGLNLEIWYQPTSAQPQTVREPFLSLTYQGTQDFPFATTIRVGVDLTADEQERKRVQMLSAKDLPVQLVTTKGLEYTYLVQLWDKGLLTSLEDDVVQMLQIIDPDIERVANQITHKRFIVKLKDQQPVPLGSLGEGVARAMGIAISLSAAKGGYLLVDEIGTGLHYRAIADMWKFLAETARRLQVQVFATTHSWDCIRSFAEALQLQSEETGALFRLQRRGERIEAVKYAADDLAFIVSQNSHILEVR